MKSRSVIATIVIMAGFKNFISSTLAADSVGDLRAPRSVASGKESAQIQTSPVAAKALKSIDIAIDSGPLDESRAIAVQDCIVKFSEELNIPSTESGLIAELSVETGDAIQWGDPIARLDDRKLRIQSKAASLRLESAMQQSNDDLELQYAEKALEESKAELDASRAIYNDAAGAVPLTTLRRLRLSVERADLEVARAKKAASLSKIEVDLRSADVSVIDDTLRRLHLQSPLSGVVLQVYRQRGEWVTTGESVARVARLDRLDVHAILSADRISPQACRDQSVSVRWMDPITKVEHRLRGRVASVQPQRVAGSRYRIQATIANDRTADGKDWMLHPGTEVQMFVYPTKTKDTSR